MKRRNRSLGALAVLSLAAWPACTQVAGLDGPYAPAIDAPCQSSADCASGVCSGSPGWCTAPCSTNAGCPSGACVDLGQGNSGSDVYACLPACGSNADCDVYGVSGLTCQSMTTVDGSAATLCI
jgi:hypothetical protein